jgi:hypothetical protein
MEGPAITEIIAAGIVPDPLNHPESLTIDYSSGASITLEGDILIKFWQEYCNALSLMRQIKTASHAEPFSMKEVRKIVNKKDPIPFRRPSKDDEGE